MISRLRQNTSATKGRSADQMMDFRRILITAACISSGILCSAQSAEQFISWGDNAERTGDHYGASRFYHEALEKDPGQLELQLKCADAYRLSNQYPQAADLYEKVQRKDLRHTHPETLRWLGEMQLCSGDYTNAEKTWTKVKQHAKDTASFDFRRARNALLGCALAKNALLAPDSARIDHLPEPINTYDSEFGARVDTGTTPTLYFSTLRGKTSDEGEVQDTGTYHVAVYSANGQEGKWIAPAPLGSDVNAHDDNANSAWSPDHKWFYFTRCDAEHHCAIYASSWSNGKIGEAQFVPGISEDGNSTQPMVVVADGLTKLFFASDRPGGQGGMDIWSCAVNGTRILNAHALPATINTPGNESCPYYDAQKKQLWFSSDFLPGLGGYDNFISTRSEKGFSTPINLGYPLNSPANDLYPTFDAKTMSGYFTSNRVGSFAKKGETCCNDIYRFSYTKNTEPVVIAPAKDTMTVAMRHITSLREKLPIRLYFHNDEPDPRSWDTLTTLDYARTYMDYKNLQEDYFTASKGNPNGTSAIKNFFRDEVDHGYAQLNEFIVLLKRALREGQRIELQVRGFASPLAKTDYNKNLSLRRIESMINYLRSLQGGLLTPYLDGTSPDAGRLTIKKLPFGEDKSASGVSDVLQDLKNSVYSVGAARERRIEIEQVMLSEGAEVKEVKEVKVVGHDLKEGTITQDMGSFPQLKSRETVFTLRNTGTRPLVLLKAKADCDCTAAQLPKEAIAPGSTQDVIVRFNGRAPEGHLERGVTITTDGDPATIRLVITGTLTTHE